MIVTTIIKRLAGIDTAAKHAFGNDYVGDYKINAERKTSNHAEVLKTLKIKANILFPLMKGKDVSRWEIYAKRHEIMDIIETNSYYLPVKEKVIAIIEEVKETL